VSIGAYLAQPARGRLSGRTVRRRARRTSA